MSTISNFLTSSREAIHNAINDADIAAKLATFGYDAEKMNSGKTLYETTKSLEDNHNILQAKEKQSSANYNLIRKQTKQQYMKQLKVARIAFKDNTQAFKQLMLEGMREEKFDKWEQQYHAFYHGLINNTEFQTIYNSYIPQTDVTAAAADFNATLEAHENYLIARGAAQEITDQRDKSVSLLKSWMSDFYNIAKIAFSDSPQSLEKLGIKS